MKLSDNLLLPGFKNISRKVDDYSVGKQKILLQLRKKANSSNSKGTQHFGLLIFDNLYHM